jgi:hypothetical protein
MNRFLAMMLAVPLILTGCLFSPEDDNVDAEILSGHFEAFNVTGLNYRTDTQSGSISEGVYRYVAGETVIVSLLGLDLFEFDGDSPLALADFASDFPNVSSDFENAFFNEDEFVEFQQLANLIQLLANLDADSDVENGFDVSGVTEISSVQTEINLAIPPFAFYEETLIELANEIDIARDITPIISLSFLYDWTEQDMVTHTEASSVRDSDNDGAIDATTQYSYDLDGYRSLTSVYDEQSILTNEEIFEADEMGRILSKSYPRYDASGTKDFDRGYFYDHNESGQLVEYLSFYDFDADGNQDSSFTESYEYDDKGRLEVETVFENDDLITSTYEYNDDNSIASITEVTDDDNDGSIDELVRTTYAYNDVDLLVNKRVETDEGNNGVIEEYSLESHTYNDEGLMLTTTEIGFDDGDIEFEYTKTYQYDENGYLESYDASVDYDNDGVANYLSTMSYALNAAGEITESFEQIFNDGINLSRSNRYVYHKPELGKLGEYTLYKDTNGNGVENWSTHVEFTYDANGNKERYLTQTDDDNDGVVDSENVWTYSYNVVSEGVGTWLFEFYTFWY